MKTAEKKSKDARTLAVFIRSLKHYRAAWGIPAGKAAFRSLWLAAKSTVDEDDAWAATMLNINTHAREAQRQLPLM
jgi:hypothetical protein